MGFVGINKLTFGKDVRKVRQVIEKYSCDYCKGEMCQHDYQQGVKITIQVDLPNPKGGCGQASGIEMVLCKVCSEDLGIVNSKEYHDYTYSQSKLKGTIEKFKTKILDRLLNVMTLKFFENKE